VEPLSIIVKNSLGPRALTETELVAWGMRIGARVQPPLWIALRGPLGAGKSALARAVCRGAGVGGRIPSPSFTLVQEYDSPRGFRIHHVDLFRLRSGDDLGALGWEELMRSSGLVLLEWPGRAGDQLPADRWELAIAYASRPTMRVVRVDRLGAAVELIEW
jgi:tRNA threonylcarbamoyladenosine biosynthesis protein TsaE